MVECRLRDPPQAENPVEQDSFSSYRKLRFHTIKCSARMRTRRKGRWLPRQPRSARECAKAHSFLYYSSGAIRRSTHCPNFIAADCFFAYCAVTSLHTGKISSKSSRTFCTASHRCRKRHFQNGNTNFCNPG